MSEPSLFDRLLECGCRPDVPEVCDLCQIIKPEVERLRAKLQAAEEKSQIQQAFFNEAMDRAEAAEDEIQRMNGTPEGGWFRAWETADQDRTQHRTRIAELEAVLAEVVRISDRKHDAWDRAHALLDGRGE